MQTFNNYILRESVRSWLLGGNESDNYGFSLVPPLEKELKSAANEQDTDKKFRKLEEILKKHGYKIKEIRFILDK